MEGMNMMSWGESIKVNFKKYAVYEGRASRAEFWWFQLFYFLVSLGAMILDAAAGFGADSGPFYVICVLVFITPAICVTIRRLHDTGKSGWQQLWIYTIIGVIPVIVWWCTEGTQKSNKYDV